MLTGVAFNVGSMNDNDRCRIVMLGKNGERDYVDHIFDDGCPCLGGDCMEWAGIFIYKNAIAIVENIKKNWMSPHIDVAIEKATI
jgi:hypothetical protein